MTERDHPIRRRENRGPKPRETIEELYGDVLAPRPSGLFDSDDDAGAPPPPPRDAAFADPPAGGDGQPPRRVYRPTAEGAPGGFKRGGRLEFPRNGGDLTPIVLSHGLVTLFTLGIWRFWQMAAQRRSVWSHTKLAGEPFEYRGTGLEMFIGAAVAVVVLAAILLGGQMALGWVGLASPILGDPQLTGIALAAGTALLLAPLIEYARFRARRYRLRRTRWRGIRFDMRGNGLGIILRWAIWAPVTAATLGLAWPFLTTARERFMTNRTMWGREPFFFKGSAWRLMPSWALLWLLLATPALIGGAHVWTLLERYAAETSAPPPAAERSTEPAPASDPLTDPVPAADRAPGAPMRVAPPTLGTPVERLTPPAPPTTGQTARDSALAALVAVRDRIVMLSAPIFVAGPGAQMTLVLIWPILAVAAMFRYRATRISAFMEARRIAGARARCTFGGGALFSAWLATVGRSIWPGILVYALVGIVIVILLASIDTGGQSFSDPMSLLTGGDWRSRGLVLMALALNYGSTALFAMWLKDVVWFRAYFHSLCAATTLEGVETLDQVVQRAHAGAADADGLADALDVDIGF